MASLCGGHLLEAGTTSLYSASIAHAHAHKDKRLSLPGLRGPESQRYEHCSRKKWPSWTSSELKWRTAQSQRCLRFPTRNSATEDPAQTPGTGITPGNQQQHDSKEDTKSNAVKGALERAAEYKKRRKLGLPTTDITPQSGESQSPSRNLTSSSVSRPAVEDLPQVEIIRRQEQDVGSGLQRNFAKSSSFQLGDSGASATSSLPTPSTETGKAGQDSSQADGTSGNEGGILDDMKMLIEQKVAEWASSTENGSEIAPAGSRSDRAAVGAAAEGEQKSPKPISAFERAKQYKMQTSEMVAALRESEAKAAGLSKEPTEDSAPASPSASGACANDNMMEIEIVTREGVIRRKVMNPQEQLRAFSNVKDVKKKGVSGIDFAGLGFADKKKAGRPAGLANEGLVTPPKGPLPQVEILTRDAAATQNSQAGSSVETAKDPERLYKPRVTSWGVFPRPADISKTYGGGRTIRPGENLETDEEKKTREAHTAQLLNDYRKKMGLNVDPAVKLEAQQIYQRAEGLMANGRLTDALLLYELVMRKMPPQSELHGLAALQGGLCLDSQSRYVEARAMYEKLLTHPIARISKQARRFLFGFQAMEELKVDGAYDWDAATYRKYFDAFADGYNTSYKASEEEKKDNLLPYVLLFLSPFLLVVALAVSKSR